MAGVMDTINQQLGTGGYKRLPFASDDDKKTLAREGLPFQVIGVRRVTTKYRDEKTGQQKEQWNLDILFLENDGVTLYTHQDDETEEEVTFGRTLTLPAADHRNQHMELLRQMVAASGLDGVGPLKLVAIKIENQPRPLYKLEDYDPNARGGAPAVQPAPATAPAAQGQVLSPDGKLYWDGAQWKPLPPPPDSATPEPQVRAADILPFSAPPAEGDSPEVKYAQPIPTEVETVTGGDGEGGVVSTVRVKGKIREARYKGKGVVEQPSGVSTLNAVEDSPVEGRSIAQEPATEGPQGKTQPMPHEPVQAAPAARDAGMVRTFCDTCNQEVSGKPFQNRRQKWIIAHTCSGTGADGKVVGTRVIDVHDIVES